VYAGIDADRALYTSSSKVSAPRRSVPARLLGGYTALVEAKPSKDQELAPSAYPQGHGVATLTVKPSGVAGIRGMLADGTPIRYKNALSKANTWPMYVRLQNGKGAVCGWVSFKDSSTTVELEGPDVLWFKAPKIGDHVGMYPVGWSAGLLVDVIGSKYDSLHIFPGLPLAGPTGNVDLLLQGGGAAGAVAMSTGVTIDPQDRATFPEPNTADVSLKFTRATGMFNGSFVNPGGGKPISYRGVVVQAQQRAKGYFFSAGESGSVELRPKVPVSE
jgi:hypothetical protein